VGNGPMCESARLKVDHVMDRQGPFDRRRPPLHTKPIRRKAEVVAAARGGLLSLKEARGRCSMGEFPFWPCCIDRSGPKGLGRSKSGS
jgi:Protein of unknown function (DUF1153)